jgi:hypothetical protein
MSTDNNDQEILSKRQSINETERINLDNINNTKEVEKQFLEGEEHKEIKESHSLRTNLTEIMSLKEDNNSAKQIFLKDKISKMKIDKNLLNGINKSMDKQMKNVENDILENHILMTEVPKNLNKLLSHSSQRIPITNFEKKNKLKTIKDLQVEKESLNLKLQKIISNEKILDNEGYLHADGISGSISPVDQKIYNSKKKLLNEKKNELLNKIDQIEDKLKQIIINGDESTRKERIKNYLENFERDKEIIETRAKKYFQETKERNQRIANDLNKKAEKIKKEIYEKCKEEELKKNKILKKLKEQEKAVVQKRTKINDEKVNMYKPFLKNKFPKDNIRQYLFVKKDEEYQEKEKNLVDKENIRRKEKMKMDFNEINEFEKNVINNREKFGLENAERKKKLILEWKERKGILPTYISRKQEMVQDELKKEMEMKEHKKELTLALKQKKILFGNKIKNHKQPEINDKLKTQRTNLIKSLENPRLAVKEYFLIQRKKKFEELLNNKKENEENQENEEETENKENNETKENNENKEIRDINTVNSKRTIKFKLKTNESINKLNDSVQSTEKKNTLSPIKIVYPVHPKPQTKIDYLSEMRIEKEKKEKQKNLKRNALSSQKTDGSNNDHVLNNERWDKVVNSNKGSLMQNINIVKEKAKIMDDEIKQKEKILKLNGGVGNNPEIGEKISNLIIDSIEAKLSILNKFNEK